MTPWAAGAPRHRAQREPGARARRHPRPAVERQGRGAAPARHCASDGTEPTRANLLPENHLDSLLASRRILVVEDEAIVALDIEKSLRELGFEVTGIAVSSDEAIEKAAELRPDLVLMDIRIQGELDGIQTAERLQNLFDLPVIYLTAHGDAETLARAKKTAPLAFLIKPFNKLALQSSVEMALFKHDMETRLRERERWLSTTFGSLGDALISVDRGARVMYLNGAAERLTGTAALEAAERPVEKLLRLVDEAGRPLAESPVQSALREERHTVLPEIGVVLEGRDTALPCRMSVSPVKDGRRLLGAVMLLEDISEQKKLRAARELEIFRALFDRAAIGMTMVEAESGRYVRVNQAFCKITGYAEHELLGLTFMDLTHPADLEEDRAAVRAMLEGREAYAHEKRYLRKSGELRWVRVVARPVDAGGTKLFTGAIEDITERKHAELHARFLDDLQLAMGRIRDAGALAKHVLQALARHLEVGLAVFGEVAAGVVTIEEEHRDALPSAAGLHRSTDYISDEAWQAVLAGEDFIVTDIAADPRTSQRAEAFRRFGISAVATVPSIGPQGPTALLSIASPRQRTWRPDELQLLHDVAARLFPAIERARAEEALRQKSEELESAKTNAESAKADAEKANQAKDQFLAILSHELRTPLTPVLAAVDLMERRHGLSEETRASLDVMRRNVQLQARLIDDLLDLTRIAQGKLELRRKPVNLCTVIERAIEIARPDIVARRIEFGAKVVDPPHRVNADASRLQQVVWNLLTNAIKFTPEGGCVGLRCERENSHVVIEVSDSGIGIEPDHADRIFNAFEQGGRHITRQFGGLGLGLAIAKRLVEMHAGSISVHSEGRNRGATFRVRLPLSDAPLEADEKKTLSPAEAGSKRILLVEDNGDTALTMKELLETFGYEVETAGDVSQALQALDSSRFDLLVSDLGLPDRSGVELMQELRRRGNMLKGIALSGYGQQEDILRSEAAGFSTHLVKPVDADVLIETIATIVSSSWTT